MLLTEIDEALPCNYGIPTAGRAVLLARIAIDIFGVRAADFNICHVITSFVAPSCLRRIPGNS